MKKSRGRFVQPKIFVVIGSVLLAVSLMIFLIVSFLGNLGKNTYALSSEYDDKVNHYYVNIDIDQPREETILLQSSDAMSISMETLEDFQSDEVELETAPDEEEGVQLKIKATKEKVRLAIPVPILDTGEQTFQIVRNGKVVQKHKVDISENNKEQVEELEELVSEEEQEQLSAFAEGQVKMFDLTVRHLGEQFQLLDDGSEGTAVVSDYQGLIAAVNNAAISRIEFAANIVATSTSLSNITRDLTIDGKGYSLTTTANTAFKLGDTKKLDCTFELLNLSVNYSAKRDGFITSSSAATSLYWSVKLKNIEGSYEQIGTAGSYFLDVPRGNVEIQGYFWWYSNKTVPSLSSSKGVICTANVHITNGADVVITAAHAIIRLLPGTASVETSLIVDQGSKVKLSSELRQAVWANTEGDNNVIIFSVVDEGTELIATSKGTFYGSDGGVITLQGSAKDGRDSKTEVLGGAVVSAHAQASSSEAGKANPKTTSAFVNQVKDGIFNLDGKGTVLNLEADGEAHSYCATLRFRLVGAQTFSVTNQAQMNVTKHSGSAAAIRLYGKNNSFIAKSGGKVNIIKEGTNRAQNGGDTGGQQAIQFTVDSGGVSYFEVEDSGSTIYAKSDDGPAIEALSGNFQFTIGKDSTFRMEGTTYGENRGIVHAGASRIDIQVDEPIFYDFRNNRVNGGQVFSTGSSGTNQVFASKKVSLSVWKKKNNVDLDANPDVFWSKIGYELTGRNFGTIAYSEFPNQFNSTNYEGADKYTRMTGNNYRAVVDELRVPTNADKHVYGHVTVPYSDDGSETRDAWEEEVWVTVQILRADGTEKERAVVPTKGKNDTLPGVSIYGEEARGGIFDWELSDFLSAGDQIKVLAAYRGGSDDTNSSQNIHSIDEDIKAEAVTVQDVTPPLSLSSDMEKVADTTKQLTGTIDLWDERDQRMVDKLFIFAKKDNEFLTDDSGNLLYKEITAASEPASEGATSKKKWVFDLAGYLLVGETIEIFAKDAATIEGDIGALPESYTENPNGVSGNINPSALSYDSYIGYHDAVGDNRFTPSLYFDVKAAAPSNPEITIDVPEGFDRNEEGVPILTEGNQLLYEIIVKSGDNRDSGRDPVKNLKVTVTLSPQLQYDAFDKLLNNAAIESYEYKAAENLLDIYLKSELKPGNIASFSLSAIVKDDSQPITTTASVVGDSTLEEPFIAGPPNDLHNHKKLSASDDVLVVPGVKKENGEAVYLSVVNQCVKVFYSNISEFTVYMDGKKYKSYTVPLKKTTDSKQLDIPIDDIRNKISVKYNDGTGDKWVYWNNDWNFVTDQE
ncbi:pectate lyase-like adhesive domain-containing protein [uncultured Enterococcus sp.]|uniref:pectate lyase-like adhesive domain-containing protein n=1 Tax=uncultured Enterococcus sp. TaxID=167972 RepID=UPI002AA88780|nr:pectate lyase-like adhesive domain-containing protein [uncultured Enterococcus sp.]